MASGFTAGQPVQTPLGKGVVVEARRNGRLLIDINGRSVVLDAHTVAPLGAPRKSAAKRRAMSPPAPEPAAREPDARFRDIDLHGLTVAEALAICERALNDALLADASELRLIHGKGRGRIRAALHRRLREIPSVRAFRLDPRNEGVTIVTL